MDFLKEQRQKIWEYDARKQNIQLGVGVDVVGTQLQKLKRVIMAKRKDKINIVVFMAHHPTNLS